MLVIFHTTLCIAIIAIVTMNISSKDSSKSPNRQERESCINNVKLNPRRGSRPSIDNTTYTKRQPKLQRGSLENVSTDPWGDSQSGTLRRSRSLAITREDVFTNLDYRENGTPRRSQLIPRAKLIERPKEPRYAVVRNLTPPDYSPPRRTTEAVYSSITNLASPKFVIGKEEDTSGGNKDCRVSYDELPGLSLPNYYPDSKYDTDNTDAISLADDLSSYGDNLSKKYSSCDNISAGKWTITEPESIPYDDNIVLSTNRPLYDSIKENHYAKPRTIRGPTPYNSEKQTYYRDNRRSYSSDSSEEKHKEEDHENDNISLEYFETDKNLDEINENITRIVEIEEEKEETKDEEVDETLITNIEVVPPDENDNYKTVVAVEPDPIDETEEEKNKHSHNYLREFLETQKGSKKPLQNFITKKLSNLSRKSTNLIDNRFYSLPDLAVTKSLRKCEKIDRKLRKCDKTTIKKPAESGESRFIVNIGKHFDITANANIPVDFELKIAKVPRKNKKKSKHKPEEQFLEAVRSLKATLSHRLDENHNITKPEIVAVQTKMDECTKEYHEKLGTMRTYWDKMINGKEKAEQPPSEDSPTKCKIVDVQTKVEDVKKKFEPEEKEPEKPSKVQIAKQLFEKKPIEKVEKISPFIKESCNYFENSKNNNYITTNNNQYESLNPNTVEIVSKDDKKHKPIAKSMSITNPEFDHVRYRVVKSDLFQKKIFANCEKESQFDGLMQYLQDYSFQELLRDNNIVIIEPIRTKIQHESGGKKAKTTKNVTPLLHKRSEDPAGLKRHFFYHPIRVNKEMNDDELPNPDTVKQVRLMFEGGLPRSRSSQEFDGGDVKRGAKSTDPDKDHCSATDSNSNPSNMSDFGSQENLYDSLMEHCCERQYVSEDVLEKIRECGTTVTYYGGRVVKKQSGQPVLTKAIMEEIKNNEMKSVECNCKKNEKDGYQGVKFKLIKSNSCSSRLELVGTSDLNEAKEKYLNNRRKSLKDVKELENKQVEKNVINESIKKKMEDTQPKIIGEERKMTQWGDVSKEKTYSGINFNNAPKAKIMYDYHNYDTVKTKTKKIDDMEFEPYEVA
ncbi:protein javelin [Zophobas morio]|uniref:protein javelin n=1 Tax=Zophobas morio TaxID=2755281 RepID=UPI00308283ED